MRFCHGFVQVEQMHVSVCDADGAPVNESDSNGMCYPNMPICLPCWPGCKSCQDGTPCWVQEDWLLRSGVLAIQGVFMLLIFISMLVAYRHRRNRVSQIFWLSGATIWIMFRWKVDGDSCAKYIMLKKSIQFLFILLYEAFSLIINPNHKINPSLAV